MTLISEKTTVRVAPFGMDFVFSVYYLAAPLLLIELKAGPIELGLVGTLAAVVHMSMAHLMGGLSDGVGRRPLILGAPLAFSASCLLVTQVKEIWLILGLSVINGFCLSIYWPSLQAWIAERKSGKGLAKDIGSFNMSWTSATLAGPMISGALYSLNAGLPFLFAALISLLLFLLVFRTVYETGGKSADSAEPLDTLTIRRRMSFLHAAWVANFASWFIMGNARFQFPKLARELDIAPHIIGLVFSSLGLALLIGFFVLRKTDRWHFRNGILLPFQSFSMAGLGLIAVSHNAAMFALAFFLIGISCSVTYYSSLYYAVSILKKKGRGSGLHESILGIGAVLGPILGGVAAQYGGVRAPYLLCAAVLAAAMVPQCLFLRRKTQK